jgi:hypothetical protein
MTYDMDDAAIGRALSLEMDIDTDLRDPAKSILIAQLTAARSAAIDAARALLDADPHKPEVIMGLQNDVRRFRNLTIWLRNAQSRAAEAFSLLPPDEQQEVLAFTRPHSEINDA